MEHAIRQQIKVKLENSDPALYHRFKDRMENILQTYQGNWDMMIKELEELRGEISAGRKEFDKVPKIQAPFMDLISLAIEEEITEEIEAKVIELTKFIYKCIKEGIEIANFWEKNDEKKKVSGKIEQRIRHCGIVNLIKKDKELAVQIMMLAKDNYSEILNAVK